MVCFSLKKSAFCLSGLFFFNYSPYIISLTGWGQKSVPSVTDYFLFILWWSFSVGNVVCFYRPWSVFRLFPKCWLKMVGIPTWFWFIRFWWNFEEMFLVENERLMSLVTCSPILARACPSFRPKLCHFWSQNIPFSKYLEFGSSDFDETLRKWVVCVNFARKMFKYGNFTFLLYFENGKKR